MSSPSELPPAKCSDCIAFLRESEEGENPALGHCRLRAEMGLFRDDLPACTLFKVRSASAGKVQAPKKSPRPRRSGGGRAKIAKEPRPARPTIRRPVVGQTDGEFDMDRDGLKQVLRELLEEETLYGYPEMGDRFQGGNLIIKPAHPDQQPKEVPLETFFHKIVMLRDRLRVLEAKLNGSKELSEQSKVELQSYVSKCYGTLTTFNVLFADRDDHFRSK